MDDVVAIVDLIVFVARFIKLGPGTVFVAVAPVNDPIRGNRPYPLLAIWAYFYCGGRVVFRHAKSPLCMSDRSASLAIASYSQYPVRLGERDVLNFVATCKTVCVGCVVGCTGYAIASEWFGKDNIGIR